MPKVNENSVPLTTDNRVKKPFKKSYIVVQTHNGKKRFPIPEDVSENKVDEFQQFMQAKWEYDHHIDKKFKSSNGKVYPLPCMNLNMVLKLLPKDEKDIFSQKDREIRSLTGKLNVLRNKVYGTTSFKDGEALFDEYATDILEMLGKGWNAQEVHAELLRKSVDIPYQTILTFHNKNREKVTALRNEFNEGINDVSLSNKRSRLERLNYLYYEILQDFEKSTTPALKASLSRELRGIIEQAKKEVEGEELKLKVDGSIDVNATMIAAIDHSRNIYGLTIMQMIIARVAARLKLPSQYLIDRLAHSYYAKYNGYRTNDDLKTKPIYPTSIQYDILSEEMQGKNAEWEQGQKKLELYEDIDIQHTETVDIEREAIKKRLKEKLNIK